MIGEIIVIHVGQCGNRIGVKFWETLAEEHGIDCTGSYCGRDEDQQLEKVNVFFKNATGDRFIPRAVLVDLEPQTIDSVRSGLYGQLFKHDNFIIGQTGSGNNWAKGYYTEGAELIDSALDVIRKEAEECQNLQGFIVIHSIGGGTGSGMGTLLISKLREEYQNKVIATFSVFPSPKVSDTVIEPYNAMLSIDRLKKYADLVFCLDNEALYDICFHQHKISNPTNENLNQIIVAALSNITAPLRFPAQGENCLSTLQNMVDKLVPVWPITSRPSYGYDDEERIIYHMVDILPTIKTEEDIPHKLPLHFLNISLAPTTSASDQSSIMRDVFSEKNILTSTNPRRGKYLSSVTIFRGQITDEMSNAFYMCIAKDYMFAHIKGDRNNHMIKLGLSRKDVKAEVALITDNTAIQEMFKRIAEQFTVMFRRKAYLHWYTGEGMDEMEFTEAESNLSDLITEYQNFADYLGSRYAESEEETE